MSFILDALKKSETDRQQKSTAEFAAVPTSSDSPGTPRWLWVLGLLLAINLVVLLGLVLRPDTKPPSLPSTPAAQSSVPAVNEPSFAEQVAAAKQNLSASPEPAVAAPQNEQPMPSVATTVVSSDTSRNTAALPSFHTVRANGTVELPDLHLDIHVYSDAPEDRFVFINMSKLREKSQLAEGPVVEEITPEGVVLEHHGTSFLLTRD
ncbi:MAG: general secretion pathway protein GspB [Woeseiaceae bacterium]